MRITKMAFIIFSLVILTIVGLTSIPKATSPIVQSEVVDLPTLASPTTEPLEFASNATLVTKSEENLKIPVLLYHEFCIDNPKNDLYTKTSVLEENISTLQENGYSFITFADLYAFYYENAPLPEKSVILTCDDGYLSNFNLAYPIFQKLNVKVAIFVVDSLVGKQNYFTWDEAKQMKDSGLVDIYSHGKNHIDYTKVTAETLKNSINFAQTNLEQHLGPSSIKVFAYPAGKYNSLTVETLKDLGFSIQVITDYGRPFDTTAADLTGINRIRCTNNTTGAKIIQDSLK